MEPGWVVVRRYIFCTPFLPVRTAFSALITITWSPVSRKGVQVGLFLPDRTSATAVLRRPTVMPAASTRNHWRLSSLALGK